MLRSLTLESHRRMTRIDDELESAIRDTGQGSAELQAGVISHVRFVSPEDIGLINGRDLLRYVPIVSLASRLIHEIEDRVND